MNKAIVPSTATSPSIEIAPAPTAPPRSVVWPVVSAALAFAAREIVPRAAYELLAAWDRRASRSAPTELLLRDRSPLVTPGQQCRRRHRGDHRTSG
ncbi:MAG: hypothetical protein KKA73_08745 [Chloroflexi bacterium]|nr:hypothetical protein [Chloroflexota bacterium]